MEPANSGALEALLKRGELVESTSELTPDYLHELKHTLLVFGDIHEHGSYGPWKRGLVKVMAEENFHLRNGRNWSKRISQAGGEAREELQRAVDWMFPLTVEWFGLPDNLKQHSTQLDYRLKGLTNDQL